MAFTQRHEDAYCTMGVGVRGVAITPVLVNFFPFRPNLPHFVLRFSPACILQRLENSTNLFYFCNSHLECNTIFCHCIIFNISRPNPRKSYYEQENVKIISGKRSEPILTL